MKDEKNKEIAFNAVICALYVVLCFTLNSISFGALQFRMATLLVPLGCIDKRFAKGIVLGVIIANLTSSLGLIDVIVGATIELILYYCFAKEVKNIYILAVLYALLSGVLVGTELYYMLGIPFGYSLVTVGISGLILFVLGIPFCRIILKRTNWQVIGWEDQRKK